MSDDNTSDSGSGAAEELEQASLGVASLASLSVEELRSRARAQGIRRVARMRKADLIRALEGSEGATAAEEDSDAEQDHVHSPWAHQAGSSVTRLHPADRHDLTMALKDSLAALVGEVVVGPAPTRLAAAATESGSSAATAARTRRLAAPPGAGAEAKRRRRDHNPASERGAGWREAGGEESPSPVFQLLSARLRGISTTKMANATSTAEQSINAAFSEALLAGPAVTGGQRARALALITMTTARLREQAQQLHGILREATGSLSDRVVRVLLDVLVRLATFGDLLMRARDVVGTSADIPDTTAGLLRTNEMLAREAISVMYRKVDKLRGWIDQVALGGSLMHPPQGNQALSLALALIPKHPSSA